MASEQELSAGAPVAPVTLEARPDDDAPPQPPLPRERGVAFRALRWALRRSYLALLTYPGVVVVNLVKLAVQHGLGALADGGNWLRASYLNLAVPYLFHHPVIIAPALLVAGAFVWLGWQAERDYARERAELERWRQWQDQQETLRQAKAQAQQAAERAGERAVVAAETRAEAVAVVTATSTATAVAEREVPVLLTAALEERDECACRRDRRAGSAAAVRPVGAAAAGCASWGARRIWHG